MIFLKNKTAYTALRQRPSDDALRPESPVTDDECPHCRSTGNVNGRQSKQNQYKILTIINVVLFLSALSLAAVSISHRQCTAKALNTYSPMYDRLDLKAETKHFNNTFWNDYTPSPFQQRPSPEVDAAWDSVAGTQGFAITGAEVRRMGLDATKLWRWPESVAGSDAYVGMVDIFHQLHCLNMMRRMAFPEYYGDLRAKHANASFPFENHYLHCQYLLFNVLTCHADVEVITFRRVAGVTDLFPDFAMDRKCRRFDDILKWKNENMIVPPDTSAYSDPQEGVVEIDALGLALPWPKDSH